MTLRIRGDDTGPQVFHICDPFRDWFIFRIVARAGICSRCSNPFEERPYPSIFQFRQVF